MTHGFYPAAADKKNNARARSVRAHGRHSPRERRKRFERAMRARSASRATAVPVKVAYHAARTSGRLEYPHQ